MINFENNGKKYSIRFFYENAKDANDPNPLANVTNKQIKTTCKISEFIEDKYMDLAIGVSVNYKTDSFTKKEGRKIAMTKALRSERRIDLNNSVKIIPDKVLRTIMWQQYFAHHKEGRSLVMVKG